VSSSEWCDDELFQNTAPIRRVVLTFGTAGKILSPNVDISSRNFNGGKANFVVDTGAELNLIKHRRVKTDTPVNFKIKYTLFGITDHGVKTFGEVYLNINGVAYPFQIVPNDFPVNSDGMLGMPFLSDSVIDLQTKTIKHQLGEIPFSPTRKGTTLILKARTKQLVTLPVTNDELFEGYLPLIPTGPGVYLGQSLAAVRDGSIRVYCINTGTRDVELFVPPAILEEFDTVRVNYEAEGKGTAIKKSGNNLLSRFEKLVPKLHLQNLNTEEKRSLLQSIAKYPYQFFLDGDKLGCTNVLKHKINTVDNTPVNKIIIDIR
jgi:hypothetical protein